MKKFLVALVLCTSVGAVWAQPVGTPPSAASRAREAQKVVLAKVVDVQPRFDTNRHGDHLIVSGLLLEVEETWKGPHTQIVQADVEGGTIGALTLEVSDIPKLHAGDRAVFFLDANASGNHVPHGRGLGIMKLNSTERVDGTGEPLSEVRRAVRGASR